MLILVGFFILLRHKPVHHDSTLFCWQALSRCVTKLLPPKCTSQAFDIFQDRSAERGAIQDRRKGKEETVLLLQFMNDPLYYPP